MIDTTNSGANIAGANFANQEYQKYYDLQEQQYIACEYNSSLEQVTLELALDIILEEESDGFHQWANQYEQWNTTSYTPVTNDDERGYHIFNVDNSMFSLTKSKLKGTSNTRIVSKLSE